MRKDLAQVTVGHLTIYRLGLECLCNPSKKTEKCAKFLKADEQHWPQFMGRLGNGFF